MCGNVHGGDVPSVQREDVHGLDVHGEDIQCGNVRQCAAVCGSVRRCSFDAATPVHNTFLYHQQQIRIKQLSFESRFDFQIFICIPRLLHLT